MLPNHLPLSRVGVRVERGVPTAVERNRAKRVLRHACQRVVPFPPGYDILVILKKQPRYRMELIARELNDTLEKIVSYR